MTCCIFGTIIFLFLGCIVLVLYTWNEVNYVNSDQEIYFSTTENVSLSELTHKRLHWYASDICIKKLDQERVDTLDHNEVTVSMNKKNCEDVHLKYALNIISKSFTKKNENENAQLYFFWISKTNIRFKINITSNTTAGYLSVYIIYKEKERRECQNHIHPTSGIIKNLVFYFNGSSTDDVNCTRENSTSRCTSSVVPIPISRHYIVCMLFSAREIEIEEFVSYDLLAYEVAYDLTSCQRIQCRLNETQCCISYKGLLQEMDKPTCIFLQNTAVGGNNQALGIPFPFTITSHKKWDAVQYSGILSCIVLIFLSLTLFCKCSCLQYEKRHPDRSCVELRIANTRFRF